MKNILIMNIWKIVNIDIHPSIILFNISRSAYSKMFPNTDVTVMPL
jgi:hypothetical protein